MTYSLDSKLHDRSEKFIEVSGFYLGETKDAQGVPGKWGRWKEEMQGRRAVHIKCYTKHQQKAETSRSQPHYYSAVAT